jgi:hypothetical protein
VTRPDLIPLALAWVLIVAFVAKVWPRRRPGSWATIETPWAVKTAWRNIEATTRSAETVHLRFRHGKELGT